MNIQLINWLQNGLLRTCMQEACSQDPWMKMKTEPDSKMMVMILPSVIFLQWLNVLRV